MSGDSPSPFKITRRPVLDAYRLADRHEPLVDRVSPKQWGRVVSRAKMGDEETAVSRLQNLYTHAFPLDDTDLIFVQAVLASRIFTGEYFSFDGDRYTLVEGHGHLRDYFDPDIDALIDAGLLEYPRVDGEPTKRLYRKPFYSDTAAGRDISVHRIIERNSIIGPEKSEPGEKITHAVGARLALRHAQAVFTERTLTEGLTDYAIPLYPDNVASEGNPDVAVVDTEGAGVYWAAETKTTVEAGGGNIRKAAEVMGRLQPATTAGAGEQAGLSEFADGGIERVWVVPNRAVAADLVNELVRNYYLQPDASLGPATENHALHHINERVERASPPADLPYKPVTKILTYQPIYEFLRRRRASLFNRKIRELKPAFEREGQPIPKPEGVDAAELWDGIELDQWWPRRG